MDDGVISRLGEQRWLVGTTSGGVQRILQWLERWHQTECAHLRLFITNVSSAWGVILLSGPKSRQLLSRLVEELDDPSDSSFPHMTVRSGRIGGVGVRIHRVSFTGEVSYEIGIPTRFTAALWDLLMETGQDVGIAPFGIESLNVMRLEKGFLHVGSDTDGNTTPDDVGYGRVVENKPADFLGRRSLQLSHLKSPKRLQLVGLQGVDPTRVLEAGAQLLDDEVDRLPAQTQGHITSSGWSPTLQRPLALGLLSAGRSRLGQRVSVYSRGRWTKAIVASAAAYDPTGGRLNA
jgi:sarcosine oxidase subunit alpha